MSRRSLTPIILPADPVSAMEAATKQYVDTAGAGGGVTHVVDPTEPVAPEDGMLWTDPDEDSPFLVTDAMPRGRLGSAESTVTNSGIGNVSTLLTGMQVTALIPAGRWIRATFQAVFEASAVSAIRRATIYVDGTQFGVNYGLYNMTGGFLSINLAAIGTPAAGSHTFDVRVSSDAGTVNVYAKTLIIEDLGKT